MLCFENPAMGIYFINDRTDTGWRSYLKNLDEGKFRHAKKNLIINTGGTLSSVKGCNGLVPGMRSGDMLEELRMVSRNLELEAEDFCSLDSSNIGPEDWTGLAETVAKRSYDYDGIVVIHGTVTLL